jgi:hypothetical protein
MGFLVFRKIEKKYYFKTFIVFVGVAILVLFGIYLANDFWKGTTLIYERQELVENNVATVILSPEEPDTLVEVVPDNSLEEKTPIITESKSVVTKPKPKPTIKSTPTPAPTPVLVSTPAPVVSVPEPVPVAIVVPDVPVVPVPPVIPDVPVPSQIIFPGGSGGSGGGGGGGGGSPPPAPDTTAPVITLTGVDPQIIEVGTAYSELGATVTDNLDVGLTATINATAVNTAVVGSYSVTYNVSDASGNPAIQKTRTINVIEPAGPPPEE